MVSAQRLRQILHRNIRGITTHPISVWINWELEGDLNASLK